VQRQVPVDLDERQRLVGLDVRRDQASWACDELPVLARPEDEQRASAHAREQKHREPAPERELVVSKRLSTQERRGDRGGGEKNSGPRAEVVERRLLLG
jgi:hypothetical protein